MGVEGFMNWKGNPINKDPHGGTKAASFIQFIAATSYMAYSSTALNMVTYLHGTMHMDIASSSIAAANFIGLICVFALLGGFLSDSYITRFRTVLIFGPVELLGFVLLAMQAHLPSLHPPACDISIVQNNCESVHGYIAMILYIGMYTVAMGDGCLRANIAPFGGDQFDDADLTESQKKSSFFNWFGFSIGIGSLTGLTLIVWIQNYKGWDYGFATAALAVLLGLLVFGSGFSSYLNQRPGGSSLIRMLQVFVAAFRKRNLVLPQSDEELQQKFLKEELVGTEVIAHTKGLKCLEKASISYGDNGDWSLCIVTQVEETKIILQMLPIVISAMFIYMLSLQLVTFSVQQANTMNTEMGSINISPATILITPVIIQIAALIVYDRLFVPFARRMTGYRAGITHLQRIGVGSIATSIATCVAALIEIKRKRVAEEHGLIDIGTGVPMSVLWLGLQLFLLGLTEVFSFIGLLEFLNSEVSRGMKSIGTAIFWCIIGSSSLLGSLLVVVVNKATRNGVGGSGWLEGDNLNKSYLDRYYWLLSILGFVGFFNYLLWAKKYVYRQVP